MNAEQSTAGAGQAGIDHSDPGHPCTRYLHADHTCDVLHHLTTKTEEEINKALEYEGRQKSYASAKEKIRRLQIELKKAEMDHDLALADLNKLGKPATSSDKITEKHSTLKQHKDSLNYISNMIFDTLRGPGVEIPWGYESLTGGSKEVNLNASPLNSDFILL